MFRITLAYFMRIGEELSRLRSVQQGHTFDEVRHVLHSSLSTLSEVRDNGVLRTALRASYKPLVELIDAIQTTLDQDNELEVDEDSRQLTFIDAWRISDRLRNFYLVYSNELEVANAYLVLDKGAYDTPKLLFSGENLFPADLIYKVPDTLIDVRAAGLCLAFELATGCGFHVVRTVEAVMIKYWDAVSGGQPQPEPRGMGSILRELHNGGLGDKNALAAISQIKNLHRNPLMHPEVHLDVEEAVALIGMAQSAIRALLPAIPYPTPPGTP